MHILIVLDLVCGDSRQSQVTGRKMSLVDQIALLDAERDAETQMVIHEA